MQIEVDYDTTGITDTAKLDATLVLRNPAGAATIESALCDGNGNVVWESTQACNGEITLDSGKLSNIAPWSAESPTLYTLTVRVIGHDGATIETVTQNIGFRTFRIENGIMTINGKRIVFKGADRHEFDAKRGRAITREDMLSDVVFCKRHNINAIRTSHYPNQEYWYDLCDEYGLYLIDETNMETHGTWVANNVERPEDGIPGSRPEWEGACVDRINSMMRRDYNHPSVLIWSLGNESSAGEVFRAMYRHAHTIDPNRPVHYEGSVHMREFEDVTDIESRMYAHADEIERYLNDGSPAHTDGPKKPYISCEYMHAMGNSCGNMDEYTALERYPMYQGGFIWDFIDQAIETKLPDGTTRMCYGGDFGDRPSDYEFSGDGLLFADRTPSPKAQEVKQLYANVKIAVSVDEAHYERQSVRVYGRLSLRLWIWPTASRYGRLRAVSTWPPARALHSKSIGRLMTTAASPEELVLEVSQQLGNACDWHRPATSWRSASAWWQVRRPLQMPLTRPERPTAPSPLAAGTPACADRVVKHCSPAHKGVWFSYTLSGEREFVLRRPSITTFRFSLTDNDRGAGHAFERAAWAVAGKYARCVDCAIANCGENAVEATYTYELAIPWRTKVTVRYVADTAGLVSLDVEYSGEKNGDLPTIPAFGVSNGRCR